MSRWEELERDAQLVMLNPPDRRKILIEAEDALRLIEAEKRLRRRDDAIDSSVDVLDQAIQDLRDLLP